MFASRLATVTALLSLLACGSAPRQPQLDALTAGMSRSIVRGTEFDHVVYRNAVRDSRRPLHVYIEGDGTPYVDRWTVAVDPTPRHPVMLQLMVMDPGPAVYVGRPCYFGLSATSPCTPLDWTLQRFSPRIVESMLAVVNRVHSESGSRDVELFGHSGGGTLAVLLARRLSGTTRVVTLAGNLDTAAWVALHRYSTLAGSLNPVEEGPLAPDIVQLHVAGERDRNVPPTLVKAAAERLGARDVRVIADVRHSCCWEEHWPAIMAGQ